MKGEEIPLAAMSDRNTEVVRNTQASRGQCLNRDGTTTAALGTSKPLPVKKGDEKVLAMVVRVHMTAAVSPSR